MNFLVSLTHFIGWVVIIPVLIYLVVSVVIALYAFVFWYRKEYYGWCCTKKRYAIQVGFRNFWEWICDELVFFIQKMGIRHFYKKGWSLQKIADELGFSTDEVEEIKENDSIYFYPFSSIAEYRYSHEDYL